MGTPMGRREPTDHDRSELRGALYRDAWAHACELAGLTDGQAPSDPMSPRLDVEGKRAAQLALVAALRDSREAIEALIDREVSIAGNLDVGGPAIAAALGVSRGAVQKRWPHVVPTRPGPRPRRVEESGPYGSERVSDEVKALARILHRMAGDLARFDYPAVAAKADPVADLAVELDELAGSMTGSQDRAATREQLQDVAARLDHLINSGVDGVGAGAFGGATTNSVVERLRAASARIVAPTDQVHGELHDGSRG